MVRFHTSDGRTYKFWPRAAYAHIKSEAKFREMIERGIARYEETQPKVGQALREKWVGGKEFEVLSYFGALTRKERIS